MRPAGSLRAPRSRVYDDPSSLDLERMHAAQEAAATHLVDHQVPLGTSPAQPGLQLDSPSTMVCSADAKSDPQPRW